MTGHATHNYRPGKPRCGPDMSRSRWCNEAGSTRNARCGPGARVPSARFARCSWLPITPPRARSWVPSYSNQPRSLALQKRRQEGLNLTPHWFSQSARAARRETRLCRCSPFDRVRVQRARLPAKRPPTNQPRSWVRKLSPSLIPGNAALISPMRCHTCPPSVVTNRVAA
jgi:hypothetical protein